VKPFAGYRGPAREPLCWGCFTAQFPERAKLKVRKEHHVIADIQRRLPWLPERAEQVVWDCPVPGGCTLKRPDMLYRFGDRYVQLEVDENGHEDKSCADEDTRLELIAADVGLPGLVVRINPDHDSCFGWKRLRNGESCVFVRNTAAYESLIQSAAAAVDGFISRSEPVGVRTLGLPLDWWAERG
jgi:hypothetical protein